MATKTITVTREDAEKVLAAVRKQFTAYAATNAEIAEMYADDPELVALLTTRRDGTPSAEAPQPTLVMDFDWLGVGPGPAIVWEGGPYEWATIAFHGGRDEEFGGTIAPADPIPGVHTEAITAWALGIYPEEG